MKRKILLVDDEEIFVRPLAKTIQLPRWVPIDRKLSSLFIGVP